MKTAETVTLYHGSKSGIHGAIAPISRERRDFGKGFYMGTEKSQPLTLICNYPGAEMYTLSVDMMDLETLILTINKIFQFPHGTGRIIRQPAPCGKENLSYVISSGTEGGHIKWDLTQLFLGRAARNIFRNF